MEMHVDIEINTSKEIVWASITDIRHCSEMMSNIIALEILNLPLHGLVGLKWKETRLMFGKESSEIMWITEAVDNKYYCTRAESHGCVYITRLSLNESAKSTLLTMTFKGEAETFLAKLMSAVMGCFVKKSMMKLLLKDLEDIKNHIESNAY